jgi:hypothetical protein
MFTICSFNSPDLDGYQGTRENKNVPRPCAIYFKNISAIRLKTCEHLVQPHKEGRFHQPLKKKTPRGMARGATSHLAPCLLLVTCFMRITGAPPALVKNLVRGAGLRVVSEITVGLPCENWKIRGNVHNNETSIQALANVGRFQGGLRAYWKGATPRVTDGIFSGALLLAGKPTSSSSLYPPPRGRAPHDAYTLKRLLEGCRSRDD